MTKKGSRRNITTSAFLLTAGLALTGGCTPVIPEELDTFVRDLLLSAAAAFLL